MNFLIFLLIALAILLMVFILMQPSQEEGLSGLTGQSSVKQGSFLGKNKASIFSFLTWVSLSLFIGLSLLLMFKSQKKISENKERESFLEKARKIKE